MFFFYGIGLIPLDSSIGYHKGPLLRRLLKGAHRRLIEAADVSFRRCFCFGTKERLKIGFIILVTECAYAAKQTLTFYTQSEQSCSCEYSASLANAFKATAEKTPFLLDLESY